MLLLAVRNKRPPLPLLLPHLLLSKSLLMQLLKLKKPRSNSRQRIAAESCRIMRNASKQLLAFFIGPLQCALRRQRYPIKTFGLRGNMQDRLRLQHRPKCLLDTLRFIVVTAEVRGHQMLEPGLIDGGKQFR